MENGKSAENYDRARVMQEYAASILQELPKVDRVRNREELQIAIGEMLQLLGKCSGAERVFIFDRMMEEEAGKEVYRVRFEWWAETISEPKEERFREISVVNSLKWTKELEAGQTIVVRNVQDIADSLKEEYAMIMAHHVHALMMAPLFNRSRLCGFIGMENPYNGISGLFIQQMAFVGAHLNTARENLRMFHLLEDNLEKMEKERQILNVLCEDCASVYKVDLKNDTAQIVKLDQGANASQLISPDEKNLLCYSKEIRAYYDHFVLKETAPDLLERFKCQNLLEELRAKERVSCRYQAVENANNQRYFEVRATRLGDLEETGQVLISFRHVDEIVREERKHQKELEDSLAEVKMNNEIISAISKIYFMIYRIDLDTYYFEEITGESGKHRLTGRGGTASVQISEESRAQISLEYRKLVGQFYDLSTLRKRLKDEESIAIDYPAIDSNWHLSRFIVQSRNKDGEARQVLLAIRVISEEKRREKYLIDAVEDAKRANEAKSEFLSRMSHDIRTPMNAIMGFTRVARNHLSEPDKVLDCLDKIHLSGSNLQQLINDVLDISRIEKGEFRIDSEPVKLSELCEFYEQSVRGMAEDKKQTFLCRYHDILHNVILSDRMRIGQIYMNLLSNAVKYTQEGGRIEFEVYEEPIEGTPEKVRLVSVVQDNGIGMTEEFMKEMYTQFSRAVDTRVNKVQGSGLGLAIVKKIVDQMEGTIEATSRLHEGTTFRVTLDVPFVEQEVSGQTDVKKEETGELHQDVKLRNYYWKNRTLLIAEDNDLNYEILEEQLEMYGIHCVRGVNGAECVRLFQAAPENTYDAVLMDMQMPVMNGLEAARVIRKLPLCSAKQIPIIALTANAYQEDANKCREAGMNDHLSKPVQVEQILVTVEKYLGQAGKNGRK